MQQPSTRSQRRARQFLLLAAIFSVLLLLAACGGRGNNAPTAEPPAAEAPAAEVAATEAPTVEAPAAEVPTEAPTVEAPAAEATVAPATEAVTETAPMTETAAVTETGAITETGAMTETAPMTETEAMTTGASIDPVDALLFSPAVELAAPAAQAASGVVTAPAGVNVRSGPGTNYPIIGLAAEGITGEIIGVSEDGLWWVASAPTLPEGQGWVAAANVEAANTDNVPVVPAPPVPEPVAAVALPALEEVPVAVPDELPADSLILFSASRRLLEGNRAYDLEDIYSVAAQPGSAPQLIIQNAMQPALQPGGNILAFRSTQSDQLGLSAYDFGADARVRYSNFKEDSTPRWNPAGDRLVFSSNRTGDRRWHVYLQSPTASDDRSGFPEVVDLGFGKDADWHPSSDQIVFKGCDDSGQNCGLWTINADASGRAQLTDGFNDSLPRWSPDGAAIVFMSDSRDGTWELYSLNVADGAITRLTDNTAYDGLPVWSPNGQQIAFMSNRDGAWGIWTIPAGGGDGQLITQLEEQMPDWLLQGLEWPR